MTHPSNEDIANLFISKKAQFCHAINLRDFATYCKHGGILSRGKLKKEQNSKYMAFSSDELDIEVGAFDRCFGNVNDFGFYYANNPNSQNTIPNIYGPIALIFGHEVYRSLVDIRFTKKSIFTYGKEWQEESKVTQSKLNELRNTDWRLNRDNIGLISDAGRKQDEQWYEVEVSTSCEQIQFDTLSMIRVEPLVINGVRLKCIVEDVMGELSAKVKVKERTHKDGGEKYLQDIINQMEEKLKENQKPQRWDESVLKFPEQIKGKKVSSRITSWCTYLSAGTIEYVLESKQETQPPTPQSTPTPPQT